MTDRLAEVTIEDARAAVDIDTLEEYERARGMVN
jgi:CTP:molybdopterin cytidylyltransferase MocA